MWRPWSKSSTTTTSTSSPKQKDQSTIFRCSSFKDIHNLITIPDSPTTLTRQPSSPTSTRRPVFHRVHTVNYTRSDPPPPKLSPQTRIVVYYTSLRIVRPTFEACRSVISILQNFQLIIDERDLVMDLGFMSELRELLGLKLSDPLTLPRVFIGGRYIGGADEIKHLHEIGELKKLVSGFPVKKAGTCDTCGGYRFILCAHCSGSRKIYSDKVGFRSCLVCNENGLIRCPSCSSPPLFRPVLRPINGE